MLNPLRAAMMAAPVLLFACAQVQQADQKVVAFEAKAAPVVASACAKYHTLESNPLVQLAVAGGSLAASAATGGVAGPVIASVKSFGDQFCAMGPPPGDTTSPVEQARCLYGVGQQLLGAAGVKTGI